MSLEAFDRALDARIGELLSQHVAEVQRPLLVTQRTVQAITGMPSGDFLEHARSGAFPTWKIKRLVYAHSAAVVAFIEAHPVTPRAANDVNADAESMALSRVGARRVSR